MPTSFFGGAFFGGEFFSATTVSTTGGGGKPGKRRERWSLTVDGEAYVFDSLDALIAFLDAREVQEVEALEAVAEKDARRIILVGREKAQPAPPQVRITSPVAEIRDYAAEVQAKVDRLYWKALAQALAREAEEEEDIKFIARIL